MNWSDSFVSYGPGRKAAAGGLADAALTALLREYKKVCASRYQVLTATELRDRGPRGKLWISTKVDGELWFLVKREGDVALCAYNGRVIHGIPLTDEARRLMEGARDCIVAGELLGLPSEGRPRVWHVAHALSTDGGHQRLEFRAFDLLQDDALDAMRRPYREKLARLRELFGQGQRATVVTTVEGDAAAAFEYYQEWVQAQGLEGIVVRTEYGTICKVKPSFSLDGVVIAFGERRVGGALELGELAVALMRDDGALQVVGAVSIGWTKDEQLALYARLSQMKVASTYRLPNHDGMLCRFVRPEIVVEIKCNELVDTDSHDEPIRRMVLRHDPAQGYLGVGPMPISVLVFPVFLRERTDKLVDVGCIGVDQIYNRLPFEARHELIEPVPRASTVIRRKVWFKSVRGQTAVRKYVVIRTDKSGDYPPYVVFFTDFSAGRVERLKTSMRVTASEAKVEEILGRWVGENVKRGWSELTS